MARSRNRAIGALIAGSLLFSSTGAIAAAAPAPTQPNPWAVLSVMSGGAAAASVCGAAAGDSAGACALAQTVPAQTTPSEPPPPIPVPPVEPASSGLGISPLLIGLVAVAVAVGLYLVIHKKHNSANSPA